MKKTIMIFLAIIFCINAIPVAAEPPTESSYTGYSYDSWGDIVPAPNGYEVDSIYTGGDLGVSPLNQPSGIYSDHAENLYICDTGNARILKTTPTMVKALEISGYTDFEGNKQHFAEPRNIAIYNGLYYICDSGLSKVLITDDNFVLQKELLAPQNDVVTEDFKFVPTDVVVDKNENVYVKSLGSYMGVLTYSRDGEMTGFYGSNEVVRSYTAIIEYFWRSFMTAIQRKKNTRFVPIEISGFDIDQAGDYIYTVTSKATSERLKKLNTLGNNIMETSFGANRFNGVTVFGDLSDYNDPVTQKLVGPLLIDVDVDEQGFMNVLDATTGRVFQYDSQSVLVGVFGGHGWSQGLFRQPVALETIHDKIYVLDQGMQNITVFKPNDYMVNVRTALTFYHQGRYSESLEMWEKIKTENANFETAYVGAGKAYMQIGEYRKAMDNFRMGNAQTFYSDAFKEYRSTLLSRYFPLVFGIVILLVAACFFWIFKRDKFKSDRHLNLERFENPGFLYLTSLKKPRQGAEMLARKSVLRRSISFSIPILAVYLFLQILKTRLVGFIFNDIDISQFSLTTIFSRTVLFFILWVIVCWAVTTLFDGKASFSKIWVCTAFAVLPLIVSDTLYIILSNFLTASEGVWLQMILVAGVIWAIFILALSLSEALEYSFTKLILTSAVTIFGMVAVLFLCLIVQNLLQQLITFITTIVKEIIIRS